MNNYVTFVVCNIDGSIKNFLFYAPAFTDISAGDRVIVDAKVCEKLATVVTVCAATWGSDVENALRVLCGAEGKEIAKVVGKFVFRKFEYKEGEDNE
jgi:hypothetical protein